MIKEQKFLVIAKLATKKTRICVLCENEIERTNQ